MVSSNSFLVQFEVTHSSSWSLASLCYLLLLLHTQQLLQFWLLVQVSVAFAFYWRPGL